jgi:hypothetical protein
LERKRPKCLCTVTDGIKVLNIVRDGCEGLLRFLEIISDSDLIGLNLTNHLFAQEEILSISIWSVFADRYGSLTITYKLVSSAKRLIDEAISVTMSLIYIRKRSGPRMEPWGTPALTVDESDLAPGKITF